MITGLTWLVAFQLAGEVVVRAGDLPVPGPVVGMLLLFGWLRWRRTGDAAAVVRAGTALLRHLQLLFVPAGVGVVAYLAVIRDDAPSLVVSVVGSWVLGLAVVAWTAVALERLLGVREDPAEPA